jgi:Tfp pilus assembly protein PilO
MKKMKGAFLVLIASVIVSAFLFAAYVKAELSSLNKLQSSIEELQKSPQVTPEADPETVRSLRELFPAEGAVTEYIEKAYWIAKSHAIRNLVFEQKSRELIDAGSGKAMKTLPAAAQKQAVISVYPVKISFTSGYRNMAEFVRELQNQPRMVTIENLSAKRDTDHLSVEMVLNIYSAEER